MKKHTLYTLTPWTEKIDQGPYYCPDCAVVEGYLYYAPEVRDQINIISIEFERPREVLVDLLGQENQSSPVLVFSDVITPPEYAKKSLSTGRSFIDDPRMICEFLSSEFNTAKPH